ncbi:response regulator transcription factor [Corynebacterium otitidis]|uniref:response regulator transcription factor n=1 Tax=Corynebacterium otitidis TaxID=29321 RepID=UPI00062785BF|nr:response regulator transcription factor [Corynebacterium otitidis]KKO84307.1 LuxR family transcriptional regulator [Corynebacterium otitidis]
MINVMLVDDHPVVRAGLRAILDSFDDVTVAAQAGNGAEALARATDAAAEPLDVVVMDVQMPEMGGVEATKKIAAAGGPPVLVLTTYDSEADIVEALAAGALGYLLKDAPEEELHEAVRAVARGERPMSSRVAGVLAERVTRPEVALSSREIEILRALESGANNRELAKQLFVSPATVKTHLVHIFQKLGVDNRTSAVVEAKRRRIIG